MNTGAKRVADRRSAAKRRGQAGHQSGHGSGSGRSGRPGPSGRRWWWVVAVAAAGFLSVGAAVAWWVHSPLSLRHGVVELSVERGRSAAQVAQDWVDAGVDTPAWALEAWFRWSGDARRIRAGSYAAQAGITPEALLAKMVRGDESLESVVFIEGWTFAQVRAALSRAPGLRQTLHGLDDRAVMKALGSPDLPAEGWFFPDTYRYGRGVSDRTVLLSAHEAMKRQLHGAWEQRHPDLPIRHPAEALVLASIVEKETGQASDRARIAGVFINRLRIGMPLQTDPTVIYGLGASFDGDLRKRDLQRDTPFNTYTRRGLPPHAIAMPGAQSLKAAVQPEATTALYFVARGDGSSHFSASLDEHNRAVWRYQKMPAGKPQP
ncbi:MAG: endolytic transglycosylase MltG [Betaproteobacteria bacterium]|nr:endolytic transglycosylase MltG [Betaproteobacteria bacterium]NBU50448.1 endolytic transglycosylase MltG [Betaproteobacteria bacterium]